MPEIKPFKALRFHKNLPFTIEELTSPLFDVVSVEQANELYKNPLNSIHLSIPKGKESVKEAHKTYNKWITEKVLLQDDKSGIYPYYQYFKLPNDEATYIRKGFVCIISPLTNEEQTILTHEKVILNAAKERKDLLETLELNVSPTHGLYEDDQYLLEKYMDESIKTPLYDVENENGVREVISKISDEKIINSFIKELEKQKVILADGHHRYSSSVELQQEWAKSGKSTIPYHMIYLTNALSHDFKILPTHRTLQNFENFNFKKFLKKCEKYFIIKNVADPYELNEMISGKKWAFGILHKEKPIKLRLKPEMIDQIEWELPNFIKELDLTVLHYYIIEKILGIAKDDQQKSNKIGFERNFYKCLSFVEKDQVQMAIIVNELTFDQVKKVCNSGYSLPQKSTFFYPKVTCGYLFSKIIE